MDRSQPGLVWPIRHHGIFAHNRISRLLIIVHENKHRDNQTLVTKEMRPTNFKQSNAINKCVEIRETWMDHFSKLAPLLRGITLFPLKC